MKNSAPVHMDRLARVLKDRGIELKRSGVIEIAAAGFGFHNSNEFQAAAKRGDLTPPVAEAVGTVSLADGTGMLVLRAPGQSPYAIALSTLSEDRSSQIGITPYGGLVTVPAVKADLQAAATAALPKATGELHAVVVEYDIDRTVGHGRIEVVAGRTPAERDAALAGFCRRRWEAAPRKPGSDRLPNDVDGLSDFEVIETYFDGTCDEILVHKTVTVAGAIASSTGHAAGGRQVLIDADALGTLVEAADAHADTIKEDLDDETLSSEHRESSGAFVDQIEEALRVARGVSAPADVMAPATLVEGSDFRVVHKDVLDQIIDAAESHGEDARSGVEEGLYDPEENEWVADLDEAIAAANMARAPIDATTKTSAGDGEMLYAIVRSRDYDEVLLGADEIALDRQIADYCRREWGSISGTDLGELNPDLLPDDQVIEIFYGEHQGCDTSEHSLTRGSAPISATTASQVAGLAVVHAPDTIFHPRFTSPSAIADALRAAVDADVWTDAAERGDVEAVVDVADAKNAMRSAADILTSLPASPQSPAPAARATRDRRDEIVWTTDVEADVIYDITRSELDDFGLPYSRGDDKDEWMPLTDDEFACLQPGRHSMSSTWDRTQVDIPGLEGGLTIRLGQSCIWKGEKWIVPAVEFGFGEGERDEVFRQAEAYVRDIAPLLDAIGGEVKLHPDTTDYAHGVDVFVPMSLALQFQGSDDLYQALRWLTCPMALRDGIVRVMATFNTPTTNPGYTVRWDATFDVLLEGREWARSYLRGDRDEDLTMRLAESHLAHKDAWSLWNEDWDLELDMDALARLYSIR